MRAEPRLPDASVNVTPTDPLREALVLVAGVTGVVVVVFVALAFFVELAAPLVPRSVEARVFGALCESDGLDGSPELDALVARLVAHEAGSGAGARVRVAREPQPNALALPGGCIVVTEGLLDRAESENEVAFVLAHELGHFAGRDPLEALGRATVASLLLHAVGVGDGRAASVVQASELVAERGFSRAEERAADRYALALVAATYGHVAGATQFLERMRQDEGRADELHAKFLGTHPASAERVTALSAYARERGWPDEGALTPWRGRRRAGDPVAQRTTDRDYVALHGQVE